MYQNHNPPPRAPMDPMSLDPTPDPDAGKSSMYKANPPLPYANGNASQKALDVGAGMPPGSVSHKGGYDPNFPLRRS